MRTPFSLDFVLRLHYSKSATSLRHYLRHQLFYRVSPTVCEHLPVTSIGETDARDRMMKDERLSPPPRWSGSYARRNHSSLRNRMLFTTLHEFIFTTIIAPSVTRPPSHYAQLSLLKLNRRYRFQLTSFLPPLICNGNPIHHTNWFRGKLASRNLKK